MDGQQVAKTMGWLGETWGFWIQTGAFVLSALAAAWAVRYNAQQLKLLHKQNEQNEAQARRRATVDVTLHEKKDANYIEARKRFAQLHDDPKTNFTLFACQRLTEHQDENSVIFQVLNQYEFVAAGIREGAFDESIYKRMKMSLVIRDWDTLAPYVTELRKQTSRPALYAEFEWLATKWKSEKSA